MTLLLIDTDADNGLGGFQDVSALLATAASTGNKGYVQLQIAVSQGPTDALTLVLRSEPDISGPDSPGATIVIAGTRTVRQWVATQALLSINWARTGPGPGLKLSVSGDVPLYGVMPVTGFRRKPLPVILEEIQADQVGNISPLLDVSPASPTGLNNDIMAQQLDELWGIAEAAYNAGDRDKAGTDGLTSLAKLTNTIRRGATFSRVACTITLSDAVTLESGTHYAHVQDHPDVRFTPEVDFVTTAAGTFTGVIFRAENTGPIEAPATLLNQIATAVVGWDQIINPGPAGLGHVADTDPTLRESMDASVAKTGTSTLKALAADVFAIETILNVVVFENTSDGTDRNGLPPHTFEVLVFDGDPPATDDDVVADIIWKGKPAGIPPFGSSSGTATDDEGNAHNVPFSRARALPVYISATIVTGDGFPGDGVAQVQAAIVAAGRIVGQVARRPDDDVLWSRLVGAPYSVTGVKNVTALTLGFAPSPVSSDNLDIGIREIATFDESRVAVTT